jgi:hypothetical protein
MRVVPIRAVLGILLPCNFLLWSAKAQQQIVTGDVAQISAPLSCVELISTHKFRGDCCSLDTTAGGGCQLTVLSGDCLVSGAVWFLNFTSTNTASSCPVGDFDPIGGPGPSTSPEPTLQPDTSAPIDPVGTDSPTLSVTPEPALQPVTSAPIDPVGTDSPEATLQPDTSAPIDPVGTDSPTSSVSPSSAPVVSCTSNDDCPEMFCGVDGNCHHHTCQEFYLFHPVVEYNPERSIELDCREGGTQIHVVNFGCAGAVGRMIPPSLGVGELPNQLCTGRTTVENEEEQKIIYFECFSFRDDANFTDFEARVAAASDLPCPQGLPAFYYSSGYTLTEIIDGSLQSSTQILAGPIPTNRFVEEKAFASMFSVVTTEDITPPPTMTPAPTEKPTRDPNKSSSVPNGKYLRWSYPQLGLIVVATSALAVLLP